MVQIQNILKTHGYNNFKILSGKSLAVLVEKNIVQTLEHIAEKLNAKYDDTPGSDSSKGRIKVGDIKILVKPASKQGGASAGVENETILVNSINNAVKKYGNINVIFRSNKKEFKCENVSLCKGVGADTAGRKKADVIVVANGKNIPISIKKDDAEYWETADSYFSKEAERIIDKALKDKKVQLIPEKGVFKIVPSVAVKARRDEILDVVFGSDILAQHGSVITKTFKSADFIFENDQLIINVASIVTTINDVLNTDKDVWFLIRNDSSRKAIKKYPGTRCLAAYEKRINKNVIRLNR